MWSPENLQTETMPFKIEFLKHGMRENVQFVLFCIKMPHSGQMEWFTFNVIIFQIVQGKYIN